MTQPKQDDNSWKRRVDKKLNDLSKGHDNLQERLDSYVKDMADNTALTKKIDKKLDDLIISTHGLVEFAMRASRTGRVFKWLGEKSQKLASILGQYGMALLLVSTFVYMYEHAKPGEWIKSFISIFNGNV